MNTPAPLDTKVAEERVLGWQTKLHRWAVHDEQARFGDLFNLVCHPATLRRERRLLTTAVLGLVPQ